MVLLSLIILVPGVLRVSRRFKTQSDSLSVIHTHEYQYRVPGTRARLSGGHFDTQVPQRSSYTDSSSSSTT
eukprot:2624982-Rhodomonas_salina.1